MKTYCSLFAILFAGIAALAQVGIGNTDPSATLDISASNAATPSNTDGLLIPRIDDFPATNPGADQDGMLVFATGAGTPAKGFYYWNNATTTWTVVSGASGDADWFEENTTSTPTSNTADIFTDGNVGVGVSNVLYPLQIETPASTRTLSLLNENSGTSVSGIYNRINESTAAASGSANGISNNITRSNQSSISGVSNTFQNSTVNAGFAYLYGYQNSFGTSTSGTTFGLINRFQGTTTTAYGIHNIIGGPMSTFYGVNNNNISGAALSGSFYGLHNDLTGSDAGDRYGVYTSLAETGNGDKYGEFISIPTTAGGTHYGIYADVRDGAGFAGYFIGRTNLGAATTNRYFMPENDGTVGQVMTTDGSGNVTFQNAAAGGVTLDEAYDFGGSGVGKNMIADSGAVRIDGDDGLLVTGTFGSGDSIDAEVTGTGTRMFFNPRKAAFRAGYAEDSRWDDAFIGDYSFAVNRRSMASGFGAVSLGYDSEATGDYSFVSGNNSAASGDNSFSFGLNSYTNNSDFSVVFGNGANARDNYAWAIGSGTNAYGEHSFAKGNGVTSYSYGETVFGFNNTVYTANSTTAYNAADRLFVLGNGNGAPSNALIVYKDGRMNINDSYTLPNNDGTAGQVMTTDGAGQITFSTLPAGVEKIDDLADSKSDNDGTNNGSSIFMGIDAGLADNSTDNRNVGIGYHSMITNTNGENNVAIGYFSLHNNTTGSSNTALGVNSLFANASGIGNTAIGHSALPVNLNGNQNIAIGSAAMWRNTSGSNNIGIGEVALFDATTGNHNIALGYRSLWNVTTGNENVAIGAEAGLTNITGIGNVYLGNDAGRSHIGSNTLWIENTSANADNALIYGEFDNDILRTNGELQIGNPAGTGYAFPTIDGNTNYLLRTNGTGQLSFVDPATLGDGTGTDDQTIDNLSLLGTTLRISLEDDGAPLQTVDLSSLAGDDDWTDVGIDIERQSGDVYIGDDEFTNNDFYISNRIYDWDDTSYFLDPNSISFMNKIQFNNGTASLPTITFNDANTGFYSPGANTSAYSANGSEAYRVQSDGTINIGDTTLEDYKLTVSAFAKTVKIGNLTNTNPGILIDHDEQRGDGLEINVVNGYTLASRSAISTFNDINDTTTEVSKYETGSSNSYGLKTEILNDRIGVEYGIHASVLTPDGKAGFFLGDVAIGTTSANTYTLPASRGTANQIMQTDALGNVSWANAGSTTNAMARITLAANQAETGSGITKVNFDTEDFDIGNNFNLTTDEFEVPADGVYRVHAQISMSASTSTSTFDIRIRVDGNQVRRTAFDHNGSGAIIRQTTSLLELTAGQVIDIAFLRADTITVNSNDALSYFEIEQL